MGLPRSTHGIQGSNTQGTKAASSKPLIGSVFAAATAWCLQFFRLTIQDHRSPHCCSSKHHFRGKWRCDHMQLSLQQPCTEREKWVAFSECVGTSDGAYKLQLGWDSMLGEDGEWGQGGVSPTLSAPPGSERRREVRCVRSVSFPLHQRSRTAFSSLPPRGFRACLP